MQRSIITLLAMALVTVSCNNDKTESKTPDTVDTSTTRSQREQQSTPEPPASSSTFTYTIDGVQGTASGSLLVQKDKSGISKGNDLFAILTASGAGNLSINVNFLFTTKPGTYPVVGLSLNRDVNGAGQLFGPILGGKPKMTPYKVNLSSVEDLGSNDMGGHKWRISGKVEGDVVIEAMPAMKLNKQHPASITVSNISFTNLSFDDNWEDLMNKGLQQMQKNGGVPKSN